MDDNYKINDEKFKKLVIPMTLEERNSLEKFKDALDEDDDCNYDSDIHSDGLLLRFLRARKLVLKDVIKMFKDYLKFFEDYKVEQLYKV